MKRVVALFLIASVALFAAVAPQSDLKVKTGNLRESLPVLNIAPEQLQIESKDMRKVDLNRSNVSALAVDTNEVTLVYLEDFEDGAPGWVQHDGSFDARAVWTLDDWYETGDSLWWCGDPAIGGYYDQWLIALETPAVELTAGDSTLSFQMSMAAEDPGTSGDYDGWDGANVQISNDGGETWAVLPVTGVPYNCTSMYSFGNVWGMGPGIPGWGGTVAGTVEADLGDYIGDTVIVRVVFASDGAYSTPDDASLWGIEVDSINVAGDAVYNGSVNDGVISVWAGPEPSGSFWAVDERADSIPSPTHVLRNWDPVADTTYALNLEDYFESPSVTLPDEPATLIYCNFEFSPRIGDGDEFPDVDFWRLEVSPDNGTTWNAISNILGDPTGSNYVYSDGSTGWFDFQYAYGESCNLTELAGQTVKFRFFFHSDDDTPVGEGLLIDDFVVYTQPDLPVPTGLNVALNAENVEVNWDDMDGTYQLPKSFWGLDLASDGTFPANGPAWAYKSYFGSDSALGCGLGMPYDTKDKEINFTSLDFALYNLNPYQDSVSMELWGYDTTYHLLYQSEPFVPDTVDGMQSLDISGEDIAWTGEFEVWMYWETSAKYPACYLGDGDGYLYMSNTGGTYLANNSGEGASGYGEVTYSGLEYNVYRRVVGEATQTLLNTAPLATNSFVDDSADPLVEYEYTVVCVSAGFEGQPSDGASIFVLPADHEEAKFDDGGADDIFELGLDTTVVVKLTPTEYPAKLTAMRFNALWASDVFKVKIFKDNGGMPGESWMVIEPQITAIEGWNTYQPVDALTTTPGGDGIVLRDGESVWVGVKGATTAYPAWLGADTDSFSGLATMQVPGGGWSSIAAYLRSNPMIRGYFDTDIDTTAVPEIIPAKYELAQNYPNPFNPVTTIRFELKETGMTKLEVFDITGRHVRTLLNGSVEAGAYDLRFDASALSSGVYFYRLTSGDFTDIKKMSLVK